MGGLPDEQEHHREAEQVDTEHAYEKGGDHGLLEAGTEWARGGCGPGHALDGRARPLAVSAARRWTVAGTPMAHPCSRVCIVSQTQGGTHLSEPDPALEAAPLLQNAQARVRCPAAEEPTNQIE